ncbi:MAG: hypothetical protein ACJAYU_005170 [Bradymonadia bacterium]|jgi:hypothetical protein
MAHRTYRPRRDGGTVLFGLVLFFTFSLELLRAWRLGGIDQGVLQARTFIVQVLFSPFLASLGATLVFAIWASGKALDDEPDWRSTSVTSAWLLTATCLVASLPMIWFGYVQPMGASAALLMLESAVGFSAHGELLWWHHALLEAVPRGLIHLGVSMPLLWLLD